MIDTSIYLGLGGYLKNLEAYTIKRLLTERQLHGPFKSLDDFIDRIVISIEQLTILIRSNAFRFTNIPKVELLWKAIFKLNAKGKDTIQSKLFKTEHKQFTLPKLDNNWIENAYDEMELIGFPLCNYFDLVSEAMQDDVLASQMHLFVNKTILIYGNLVTTRFNKTSQGN